MKATVSRSCPPRLSHRGRSVLIAAGLTWVVGCTSGVIIASGDASSGAEIVVDSGDEASVVNCGYDPTAFPDFRSACAAQSDCVLVSHRLDCCGSQAIGAVSLADEQAFKRAEALCDSQYPANGCMCPPERTVLDDTTWVNDESEAVADCLGGICRSRYRGAVFACGTAVCTATQICGKVTGSSGQMETDVCGDRGACSSCSSCPDLNRGGCTCVEQGIGIFAICVDPGP
jgi:hypothetical protein